MSEIVPPVALDGDEAAVVAAAHEAGIALGAMADHAIAAPREPALVLGHARASEPALRAAARATAGAIARAAQRAARPRRARCSG